jgi:hypothetical protein
MVAPSFYNLADQNIYNQGYSFIPQERFRGGAFNIPGDGSVENDTFRQPTGITSLGGGGGGAAFTGGVNDLIQNYTLDTRNQYFGSQPTPLVDDLYQSKLDKTFMGFPSYRQQELTGPDLGEYIGSGTDIPLEQTTAGKIQSTLGNVKDKASGIMSNIKGFGPISMILGSIDKFDTLSPADQEFIKQNMGYRGPTVFGENTSGLNKDPFGLNTRSAFGNYAERVGEEYSNLGESLSGRLADKYGAEFDEETGMFVGPNAAKANQMTKMMRAKYNFYGQQTRKRDLDRRAAEEAQAKQTAAIAAANKAAADRGDRRGGYQAGYDDDFMTGGGGGRDAAQESRSPGSSGPGGSDTMGSFAYGGRVPYMMGGLTDLVDIYD